MAAQAFEISSVVDARGWPLARQLVRAASSIPLNVAEGAGEFTPLEKARFYRMARRSAAETAAALDVLVAARIIDAQVVSSAQSRLNEIGALRTHTIKTQLSRANSTDERSTHREASVVRERAITPPVSIHPRPQPHRAPEPHRTPEPQPSPQP